MLEEQVNQDYIQAMKARDSIRSATLNFLRAQLKNVKIEKKAEKLEDTDVIAVLKKQIKQREESIAQYEKGGRSDLVQKETAERDILKKYLPEEMPEDQVRKIVEEAIREAGAQSMKDMGKVMKIVMAKAQGRADSRVVSETVKNILSAL